MDKSQVEKARERAREWYYKNREYAIRRIAERTKEKYSKFPWLKVYDRIRNRVKNKPDYVKYGIKNFLSEEGIKLLWFRDKAFEMKMPSIDRIDGYGNYSMENCRFIELTDNLRRPRAWRNKEKSLKNLKNTGRTHFKKGHIPWCNGKKRPEVSGKNHWTKRGEKWK